MGDEWNGIKGNEEERKGERTKECTRAHRHKTKIHSQR